MRFFYLSLTVFSLVLSGGAQVKDPKGEIISEFIFPSGRNVEAVPLLFGRDLVFTRSVRINGNAAGVFIIDTGSNISMIDIKVADELGLSRKLTGLSTILDKRKHRFFRIDSMHLGRIEIKNHLIYGGSISQNYFKFKEKVIGIIGGDILGRYPWTLDYQNLILKIHRRASFKPPGKEYEIFIENPLRNMGLYSEANQHTGTPHINAVVNGKTKIKFLIDTADESAVTIRSDDALKNKHLAGSYRIPSIFRRPGGSDRQFNALVKKVEIFGSSISESERNFILFPSPGYIKVDSQTGARILSQFILSFDYKNKKIWAVKFERPRAIRDKTDFAGHSEIARKVRTGRIDEVKKLLKNNENRKFVGHRNESLLMLAVESGSSRMMNLLIKASEDDINFPNIMGVTPLMRAAASSEVMMVNDLIDHGAKVKAVDNDNMNAIHYSVMGGSKVVTDILIRHKVGINGEMKNGMRPLSLAAGEGNLGIFKLLVDAGADLSYVDKLSRTLLHLAAFGDNADLIDVILNSKSAPAIDAPDKNGFTPLMIAAEHGRVEAAKRLLKRGASIKAMNPKNFTTALDLALKSKNDELIKVLQDAWSQSQK